MTCNLVIVSLVGAETGCTMLLDARCLPNPGDIVVPPDNDYGRRSDRFRVLRRVFDRTGKYIDGIYLEVEPCR